MHRKAVDAAPNGNTFFSPASISTAFAMLFEGSADETAAELKRLLFPNVACVGKTFHEFVDGISQSNNSFQLNVANGIFVEQSYKMDRLYEEVLQNCYGAEAESVNFLNDANDQRNRINNWVEQKTHEKIKVLFLVESGATGM
jgi:serpin B